MITFNEHAAAAVSEAGKAFRPPTIRKFACSECQKPVETDHPNKVTCSEKCLRARHKRLNLARNARRKGELNLK